MVFQDKALGTRVGMSLAQVLREHLGPGLHSVGENRPRRVKIKENYSLKHQKNDASEIKPQRTYWILLRFACALRTHVTDAHMMPKLQKHHVFFVDMVDSARDH